MRKTLVCEDEGGHVRATILLLGNHPSPRTRKGLVATGISFEDYSQYFDESGGSEG
jgi:hypothetical protein